MTLLSDRPGRLDPGSVLFTSDDAAAPTLEVATARPHQNRWLVVFRGITTREQADALRGTVLYGSPDDTNGPPDPDALWVHELVGATVVTPDGTPHGVVIAVLANPASDLLELDTGGLVPVSFIIDQTGLLGRLVVDPPEGLFDL